MALRRVAVRSAKVICSTVSSTITYSCHSAPLREDKDSPKGQRDIKTPARSARRLASMTSSASRSPTTPHPRTTLSSRINNWLLTAVNLITTMEQQEHHTQTNLLDLPDDILLTILSHLDADSLLRTSETNRKLHSLSQQGILWANLYDLEYKLSPDASARAIATSKAPGSWHGMTFVPSASQSSGWLSFVSHIFWGGRRTGLLNEGEKRKERDIPADAIPIHFPTLFRARRYIDQEVRGRGPHRLFRPTPEDALPALESDLLVIPNHMVLKKGEGKLYCLKVWGEWCFVGGRGGLVVWRGDVVVFEERVFGESLLCLDFVGEGGEGKAEGNRERGLLVVGSRGGAKVFRVVLGERVEMEEVCRLEGAVTAVGITGMSVITGSLDGVLKEYPRRDLDGAAFTTIDTAVDGGERSSITSLAADEEGIVAGMAAGLCQVSLPAHEVFRHDETAVLCVAKCAGTIVAGTQDGRIIYSHHGDCGAFFISDRPIRAILLSDEDHAIAAGFDGRIHFIDLLQKVKTRTYELQGTPIMALAMDGLRFVAALADGTIAFMTFGMEMPYRDLMV